MDTDSGAIVDILNRYAAAVSKGDFEAWMSLWAENGVQMPAGESARQGKEAIRQAMAAPFKAMDLTLELTEITEANVYGDVGLTHCRYTLYGTPRDGGETIALMPDGKALTIYGKQPDGTWKIVYDCVNANE